MTNKDLTEKEYTDFCRFLEQHCGIVLGNSKQYLVRSRLAPLMSEYKCESLSQLVKKAMELRERALRAVVIDAMTTNETLWFRDKYPFEVLTQRLLPEFADLKRPLKIWSAASSSGQEPYSIAMTCLEFKEKNPGMLKYGFDILATDISTSMLEHCNKGEYDNLALARGLSPERKRKFFNPSSTNCFSVKPEVKKHVKFKQFNLLDSFNVLGRFDIIFCRNVLIYFSPEVKRQIFANFAKVANKDGYLMLGASESINGLTDEFTMNRCKAGIVYQANK
ncbi:protein-glutamate O-methyltransferase CheR [Psychrobium sp. 1_MG-2023]|uniref:CheR family methyltransferase n=1 Tax=Psychrobium sp. 1_MG-2023 TaxID=3062624 RepID=UPI000C338892|nr:protein-glutamate O-methyltransferase CheR [Psychrobium sp. 1_MG-2023]MDP2559874.1 protein-glutamate O-methyltransferase CheR [Psychrobium sp. 1_MG-2023]PKF59025.1 chemotaxis protein CheR [Alteromonadales bacterium alter-6D02]